ncbi:hypothetical protein AcW1_001331 [Taiwanofungus camphoratus]|nr:hypothetical protein AcW1_001331 [Antrodia cinnamomea]
MHRRSPVLSLHFFNYEMLAKVFVYALLPIAVINAAPAKRGLFDDFSSIFNEATSDVKSVVGVATSAYHSDEVAGSASTLFADATSVLGTATSQVFATVTTISGVPVVEVTSSGGSAITLATSSGMTTSFAGHILTVATPSPSSSSSSSSSGSSSSSSSSSASSSSSSSSASASGSANAAVGMHGLTVSKPMLMSAATVLGSIFAGALVVL